MIMSFVMLYLNDYIICHFTYFKIKILRYMRNCKIMAIFILKAHTVGYANTKHIVQIFQYSHLYGTETLTFSHKRNVSKYEKLKWQYT